MIMPEPMKNTDIRWRTWRRLARRVGDELVQSDRLQYERSVGGCTCRVIAGSGKSSARRRGMEGSLLADRDRVVSYRPFGDQGR